MNTLHQYHILIYYDKEDEIYVGKVPDLEGCVAHGDTPEEALQMVLISRDEYLRSIEKNGWEYPEPTNQVTAPFLKSKGSK